MTLINMTHYLESPMQKYEIGKILTCVSPECPAYGKTVFKLATTTAYTNYTKTIWTCGVCKVQQIVKEGYKNDI